MYWVITELGTERSCLIKSEQEEFNFLSPQSVFTLLAGVLGWALFRNRDGRLSCVTAGETRAAAVLETPGELFSRGLDLISQTLELIKSKQTSTKPHNSPGIELAL